MASNLIFQNTSDVTITSLSFTNVTPGTPSAAQTVRLLNDDSGGSVDDAAAPVIELRQVNSSNEAVQSGLRAIDDHWIEVRCPGGGSSGSTQLATGWEPVGNLRSFELAAILEGEYTTVEIRYNPPGSAPEGSITFLLDALPGPVATTTANGLTETTRDGVLSGLGDDYYDEILYGGAVTEASTPDTTVEYENTQFRVDGKRFSLEASAETLNDQDASAATVGVGEYYWALFSLGENGVTVTKSNKATAPEDTSLVPATPTGEIPWVRVYRDDSGTITNADITTLTETGQFTATHSASSLNVTLGPGRARVGNRVIRLANQTTLALTASATNRLWLQPDGSWTVTVTDTAPTLRALLLWELTTDGSGVTAAVDYREPVGGDIVLPQFVFAAVAGGGQEAFWLSPLRRDAYLLAERSASVVAADEGSGNTTGETRFNVEYRVPGGSWTSLFSTSANRPLITHDDTDQTGAFPSTMRVPAGAILRATAAEETAYDTTAPTNVVLTLPLEIA